MTNNIYAKYQIITGNYTIGNFKSNCLINNTINESYFTRFINILNESANDENKVEVVDSDICSESYLNNDKVCVLDKNTDFIYGNIENGIAKAVIGTLSENEIDQIDNIVSTYDPEEITEMLQEVITEENNKIYSDRELVCDFIMRIEGYAIRLKELHWDADKKAQHEITEKAYDLLYKLEDSIAEDMMGYMGSYITPGTINPVLPNTDSLDGLLNLIKDDAFEFYKRIENNDNCIGIKSEIESFIHDMNNIIYLGKMI